MTDDHHLAFVHEVVVSVPKGEILCLIESRFLSSLETTTTGPLQSIDYGTALQLDDSDTIR